MSTDKDDFTKIIDGMVTDKVRGAVAIFVRLASDLNGIKNPEVYGEKFQALDNARGMVIHACGLDSQRDNSENEQRRANLDAAVNAWLDELQGYLLNTSHPDNPEDWPPKIQSYRDNIEKCGLEAAKLA